MADPKTIRLLLSILDEVHAVRAAVVALHTETQRQHARTDEALEEHDKAPGAHEDRISDVERKVERLEGKRDDDSGE